MTIIASTIGELAAFLWQVGRRKVDGDVLVGKPETSGVQGAADALAAFGDGFVGNSNDDERLLAGRNAHLHLDGTRLDADKR